MAEKIMVVDDESDLEQLIRQKFRKQIREREYEFVFAGNGLEALAKMLDHPDIAVICTDINMPEMDGLTLLTKLNEMRHPAQKTVIVSAYGDLHNIRTAMNRGAFDFLVKPIDFHDLEVTIRKTLDEIRARRNALAEHDKLLALQRDLNVAREIQQAILPKVFPPFPERREFDLFATMTPAREVGGDFYDFFLLDADRLGFVIGDVSGKGIPAAIFMAVSRTLIRATGLKGYSPGECLEHVNRLLCRESSESMFVTVFYGILHVSRGEVVYASAGHNPPLRVDGGARTAWLEGTDGIVLGIVDDARYAEKKFALAPGETLFLYTDGVTESADGAGAMFGEERLAASLQAHAAAPLPALTGALVAAVGEFSRGLPQSDDLTTLALRFLGS